MKQLHLETVFLRSRLSLDDPRIKAQEDELDNLKTVQDEVDAIWKKADRSAGIPNFNTNINTRFENLNVSGIATESVSKALEEIWCGMYSDLGGKGALSLGVGGILPYDNASANYDLWGVYGTGPVSLYIGNPSCTLDLYGDLGKWDTTFAVEAYQPDTTYGDFSRGYANNSLKRFENPWNIKSFNDDKNAKNWDDFMSNISYVPSYSPTAGNVQSTSDRVFDGIYAVGRTVPWLAPGGRMWFLVGRMGETTSQSLRWEEGAKIDQPLFGSLLRASISAEWVNDNFGVSNLPNMPQLDMKDYSADIHLNLAPVLFDFEGGFSHFYTGSVYPGPAYVQSGQLQNDSNAVEAPAGQASMAFYPLTLYYFGLSENYADFMSKATMSGFNFFHHGLYFNPSDFQDVYGAIGEVDNLQTDRYGWRVNLGWDGREQTWMKSWPSFLDTFIINFDVSQKKEYVAEQGQEGYYEVEPTQLLSFYYPDDEGLWGLDLWGNYAPNVNPLRQTYINNIEAMRNDADIVNDDVRYQFRMTSERIPLILPIYNNGGTYSLSPATSGQDPAKYANGNNMYANIDDLKTYNYITLTAKLKIDKWLGLTSPVDGFFFITDNQVSGVASSSVTNLPVNNNSPLSNNLAPYTLSTSFSNLFEQLVYDGSIMINVVKNVDLMGDIGVETWKSQYTYPQVDYRTNDYGLGLAYDIPWGGAKLEFRYKYLEFHDNYIPANNYSGNQYFCKVKFLF